MHRPLPLCWQLKYSGSKAEKDTFTSVNSKHHYITEQVKSHRKPYIFQTVRCLDTYTHILLTSLVNECTLCTSPTRHFGWIYPLSHDVVQPTRSGCCTMPFSAVEYISVLCQHLLLLTYNNTIMRLFSYISHSFRILRENWCNSYTLLLLNELQNENTKQQIIKRNKLYYVFLHIKEQGKVSGKCETVCFSEELYRIVSISAGIIVPCVGIKWMQWQRMFIPNILSHEWWIFLSGAREYRVWNVTVEISNIVLKHLLMKIWSLKRPVLGQRDKFSKNFCDMGSPAGRDHSGNFLRAITWYSQCNEQFMKLDVKFSYRI